MNLTYSDAFAKYNAKPTNVRWACSAKADDGSIVLSCWSHKFTSPAKGVLRYTDQLSSWRSNLMGKNLLTAHLSEALALDLPVRLVVVTATDTASVDAEDDTSKIIKTFHVREDLVGSVVGLDDEKYVVDFSRKKELA